ncbi:MAG: glutamate-5-semialdehyde dehydrogenase [Bdellovibrionota bacterium]
MTVTEIAKIAKQSALKLQSLSESDRVKALRALGAAIEKNAKKILEENAKDLSASTGLSKAMIDRLTLTEKSITGLKEMCEAIAAQPQVVGQIVEETKRPNGLTIQKQRIPIGVIGMIFESRPNVVIDGAALAIKSGNAIILKGGKEAQHSNRILMNVIEEATKGILPEGSISLIETREDVAELLKLNQYIDLMVPRGGSSLIDHVRKNATMPVVAHDKGLCHIYVHKDADVSTVIPIVINAKVSRPGVCNAVETLLLHKDYPEKEKVIDALKKEHVEIREEFDTEFLDKIISLKTVKDENEAIAHIQKYGSHHTEAILARDPRVIELFMNSLDASAIVVNASTRFNDGGELGLGAELGISTSKLHAYGPMGAKEMTTTRFLVKGNGQIR